MLHAGEVLQNRYEIIKVIGKGGMSTVYQARDLENNNLLAVKEVERSGHGENSDVEQKLAVGEGQLLKQLSNPHLPKIYDIIENHDTFMIVMDFIKGESLDKVIAKQGPMAMEHVLNWGMQICEVFHYLHNQPVPIIYRDMKPANVILTPEGQITMIDFGTARTLKQNVQMQEDTICIGTAGFAAPEQFGGIGQSTERTDIFCLGATLYNLITGHSPCDRPVGILPLETWNPALANSPISEIIQKCTRNDPNERYQTAMELHEDLRLASIGAYRKGQSRSGKLLKGEWQKLDLSGAGMVTNGLSGLIQRGLSGHTGIIQDNRASQSVNQPVQTVDQSRTATEADGYAPPQPQENSYGGSDSQNWSKVIIISVAVALVFVILAVLFVLMNQVLAAMVFMIVAIGGAVLAILGTILAKRA